MRQKQELKFVFHNPNTHVVTEEFLSKWIAKICVPQIEELVKKNTEAENTAIYLSQKGTVL